MTEEELVLAWRALQAWVDDVVDEDREEREMMPLVIYADGSGGIGAGRIGQLSPDWWDGAGAARWAHRTLEELVVDDDDEAPGSGDPSAATALALRSAAAMLEAKGRIRTLQRERSALRGELAARQVEGLVDEKRVDQVERRARELTEAIPAQRAAVAAASRELQRHLRTLGLLSS